MGDFHISEITLVDYVVNKLCVEASTEPGDAENPSNTLALHFAAGRARNLEEDDDIRVFPLKMELSTSPKSGTGYYTCNAVLEGLFRVRESAGISDEEIRDYLTSNGVSELYDLARTLVATVTANGRYGSFVLPSITDRGAS